MRAVGDAPVAAFMADPAGRILFARGAIMARIEASTGPLAGRSLWELCDQQPPVLATLRAAYRGEHARVLLRLGEVNFEVWCSPAHDGAGTCLGIIGVGTDVTDREALLAELRDQAGRSPITGLPARATFTEDLAADLRIAREAGNVVCAIVLLLDRVHEITETFGSTSGTAILQAAAERLRAFEDDAVAVGTLEQGKFVLRVTGPSQRAIELARTAGRALAEPFIIDEKHRATLRHHAGIAAFPAHAQRADQLVQNAEQAARAAEERGISEFVYTPSPTDPRRNFKLLSDLPRGLASPEFRLEYQPLINVHHRTVDSFEALARWQHPELGAVQPDEFIPLAERSGLIGEVTSAVFEQVGRQLDIWRRQGLEPRISVNVSAEDLLGTDFEARVRTPLEAHGVPLRQLGIEITERAALERLPQRTFDSLQVMAADGVQFAIDDFGTGYSNIRVLQQLPGAALKIDRSFITPLLATQDAQRTVGAVVQLGHSLARGVIAEGVEEPEQWDMLMELGCDTVQGYHIARPMPADAVPDFLLHSRWSRAS